MQSLIVLGSICQPGMRPVMLPTGANHFMARFVTVVDNPDSPREFPPIPSIEEMDAAGVYGPLPFDPSKLPPTARWWPLSYLRYLYRIGDCSGLHITGHIGGDHGIAGASEETVTRE